ALAAAEAFARSVALTPNEAAAHGVAVNRDGRRRSAFELLSLPDVDVTRLAGIWPELSRFGAATLAQLEIEASYAVYLGRQDADIQRYRAEETAGIPADMDYAALPGLSAELKAKLEAARPRTLGQAGRIEGMTPAALTLVAARARKTAGQAA
ncbi:tRNA uridine-5-carboxymethylaminomethyl(34) synthesis enzyme MnmG, partial [Methylopila musalis]